MVSEIRGNYNGSYNKEKYEAFLRDLNSVHPDAIEFRVAETPVFVSKDFSHAPFLAIASEKILTR